MYIHIYIYTYMYIYICICYVCLYEFEYACIYIHIYSYSYSFICLYVCGRECLLFGDDAYNKADEDAYLFLHIYWHQYARIAYIHSHICAYIGQRMSLILWWCLQQGRWRYLHFRDLYQDGGYLPINDIIRQVHIHIDLRILPSICINTYVCIRSYTFIHVCNMFIYTTFIHVCNMYLHIYQSVTTGVRCGRRQPSWPMSMR
jgi:hypothetical protein